MDEANKKIQTELAPDVIKTIFDVLSESTIFSVTDEKGNIIFANPKFAEISKYSISELIGQNHRILKSGDQPNEMFVDMWATISSGKVWYGEVKNKSKDGSYYWVDTTILPVFGVDGKIKNYTSLRTVITDRKNFEEKAQKHLIELEQMNKFVVSRELRMVELKKEIKRLEEELTKEGRKV